MHRQCDLDYLAPQPHRGGQVADSPESPFLNTEIKPRASAADPAVLGLTGLAVAALVLASGDLGLASGAAKSLMIPWTLSMGATAQLVAGLIDFRRNNMFGATAFTTYSLLWYSVSLTLFITIFTGAKFDITHYAYGLIGFLVFSLILTVASAMTNKTLFAVLVFIDLAILTLVLNIMAKTPTKLVGDFLTVGRRLVLLWSGRHTHQHDVWPDSHPARQSFLEVRSGTIGGDRPWQAAPQ